MSKITTGDPASSAKRAAAATSAAPGSSARSRSNADAGPQHFQRAMPELTAFERKGRDARQFGQPKRQGLGNAVQSCAGTDDRADIGERRRAPVPDVGRGRRSKRRKCRRGVVAKPREYRHMQRQSNGQAARRGESDLRLRRSRPGTAQRGKGRMRRRASCRRRRGACPPRRTSVSTSALSPDCEVTMTVLPAIERGAVSCSERGRATASMPSAR